MQHNQAKWKHPILNFKFIIRHNALFSIKWSWFKQKIHYNDSIDCHIPAIRNYGTDLETLCSTNWPYGNIPFWALRTLVKSVLQTQFVLRHNALFSIKWSQFKQKIDNNNSIDCHIPAISNYVTHFETLSSTICAYWNITV